jgi:hypothetical protein
MRRKKPKSVKSEMPKGIKQEKPWKSRKSSENSLRTYILINLKILKKWTDSRYLYDLPNLNQEDINQLNRSIT